MDCRGSWEPAFGSSMSRHRVQAAYCSSTRRILPQPAGWQSQCPCMPAERAVHPQTYRAPPSPRHSADGWLFRKSVVYCSLWRIVSLHVWNRAICRLHIKKKKKKSCVTFTTCNCLDCYKRWEQKLSVSSLLFLSALNMYITGSEAFF